VTTRRVHGHERAAGRAGRQHAVGPETSTPQVIALNGVSSSGKSSLARALAHGLRGVWLTLGTDVLLSCLPARFLGAQRVLDTDDLRDLEARVHRLEHHLRVLTRSVCDGGDRVLLDLVCQRGGEDQATWRTALAGVAMQWVRVDADPGVIARRESSRPDRPRGLSTLQRASIHRDVAYDAQVDTSSCDPATIAGRLAADMGWEWVDRPPLSDAG
jgi:chloramphenicol 3-O phosphotransferase